MNHELNRQVSIAYSEAKGNKKRFIEIARQRTGLTQKGLSPWLETLKFKK